MSVSLRIALVLFSIVSAAYVFRKIRKSNMYLSDSIFWVVFSFCLLLVSLFPSIAIYGSELLGVSSPANFVFLAMLFLILTKLFGLSLELSEYKFKLRTLIQEYALREKKDAAAGAQDGQTEGGQADAQETEKG
ncbi:MAG: DUF2304 domain-containing protein [Oscillospiraceae bacterium]|nr:DUF2304 domain-containing protein [Oscillospiraceae bacterium]